MSPRVAVIIPTRGKVAMVRQCLSSLFASHDPEDMDVVVIEGGGQTVKAMIDETFGPLQADPAKRRTVRWMAAEDDWGFSQINNAAAATCSAPYLLLLNDDTICRKGFLTAMLAPMEVRPEVGIVGAKLLFLNGSIQHCGVVFRSDGVPYHIGWGRKDDSAFAPGTRDDYYDAVTFACALIRRSLWEQIGGLDEAYHFNYEDVDFCLKAREVGYRCFLAHRAVVVHLEAQSLGARKTEKHSIWRNMKILRDRWLTNGKVEKLLGIRLQKTAGTMRDDRLNIAFVPSGRKVGVPWWRIELPAKKLVKLGLANVVTVYADMDQGSVLELLEKADVAVFQGFCQEWTLRIAKMGSLRPFRMVYDYDDHPIYISPLAQAYRHFGCQEIKMKDEKGETWLWRDGENLDIEKNMANRQRQLEILSRADCVTTSTKPLWDYFSTLNRNVTMLPNCIDFDVYRHAYTLWERRPGPIRIGWHGGDNHFHDVATIGPWLTKYVNANDVQLVLFGAYYKSVFKGIDPSKVVEEEWVDVEAFPYKLASLGIDVAVIPLANEREQFMQFGKYKSSIKFLEYGALRIPALVTDGSSAYSCCSDSVNCLTYTTEAEFMDKLGRLCTDADLRLRLGTAALDYVREYFDLEKNAHRWLDAYQAVLDRHAEYEAANPEPEAQDQPPLVLVDVPDSELEPARSNAAADGGAP